MMVNAKKELPTGNNYYRITKIMKSILPFRDHHVTLKFVFALADTPSKVFGLTLPHYNNSIDTEHPRLFSKNTYKTQLLSNENHSFFKFFRSSQFSKIFSLADKTHISFYGPHLRIIKFLLKETIDSPTRTILRTSVSSL